MTHAIDSQLSGEWLQARPGERFSIRIPALATDGSYSVTEILSSPGDSTPVHLHEKRTSRSSSWRERHASCTGIRPSTPRRQRWLVSLPVSRTLGEILQILRCVW
jgi:hypothetical protein